MSDDGQSKGSRHLLADAKALARRHGARGCIVMLFDTEQYASASYGTNRTDCDAMGRVLDEIAERIGSGEIPPPW